MSSNLLLLSLAALVLTVHSQLCSPPIIPAPCPAPCVPTPCPPPIPPCPSTCAQVINQSPYVTTIIDNSVSNALVNALQLLIVSNLIGATVGPSPSLSNLGPLLDSIVCPNLSPIELSLPEYINSPYGSFPSCSYLDLIPPLNPCGPYLDFITAYNPNPACSPYYDYIPPCGPATYSSYELIPSCGPIIDPYLPFCGLSDVYPNTLTYTETITPFCIESLPYGYGDMVYPVTGIETFCPNLYGLPEIIPNYVNYPIPEICPLNPYCSPYPDPIIPGLPNVVSCLTELTPPMGAMVVPSYYSGLTELPAPEMIFSTVPPQSCNGYTLPTLPCVRVNTEPLVNDNCIYGGYGGLIYY